MFEDGRLENKVYLSRRVIAGDRKHTHKIVTPKRWKLIFSKYKMRDFSSMYESPCNVPPGIYELHIHPRDLYTSPGSVNTDSWALPRDFNLVSLVWNPRLCISKKL